MAQHDWIIFGYTNIIDTISEVGGGIDNTLASRKWTIGVADDCTFCLYHSFFRFITYGALVADAAIFTDDSNHGHFPNCSEALNVFGNCSVLQLELICFVVVEIATKTTGSATVGSRDSDCDVIHQIIRHPQAKVGHYDVILPLLINLHCTVVEVQWKVSKDPIYLQRLNHLLELSILPTILPHLLECLLLCCFHLHSSLAQLRFAIKIALRVMGSSNKF